MTRTLSSLLALGLGALALHARPLPAHAETVERVVAVVNDEAIFLSDLRRRATPFYPRLMSAPAHARQDALRALYGQLLDQLIDEELIEQIARRQEIRVRSADVRGAIANVRRQAGLSEDEFWEAVQAQGYTPAQYRSDVRRQLLRMRVINQRVRARVNITEEDVREVYDERVRAANRNLRFRTSQIFFPIEAGATATEVAATRQSAERVRAEIHGENSFLESMDELGGMELGWLSQGDLPEELESALLGLAPGEVSQPVRGNNGYHLFLLHERESAADRVPAYEELRDRIYQEMMGEAMQRQESLFLRELRREAVVSNRLETLAPTEE